MLLYGTCFVEKSFFVNTEKIIAVGNRKKRFLALVQKHTLTQGLGGAAGDRMSTPAVRIVVTLRRSNTNVINTSALTPGTLCVSVCVSWF